MIRGALNFFANVATFSPVTRQIPQCPLGLELRHLWRDVCSVQLGTSPVGLVGTSPLLQWTPSGVSFEHRIAFVQNSLQGDSVVKSHAPATSSLQRR